MIERRGSRVVGGVRPLRLRYQEALIHREMRQLVARAPRPRDEAGDSDPGTLRRRRSPLRSTVEPSEL